MKNQFFLLWIVAAVGAVVLARAADDLAPETAKRVMEAYQAGQVDAVIEGTEGLAKDSPWIRLRANALQRRGEDRFFEGRIAEAIADFDAFLEIFPDRDPHHWQRGIAYYYAEEYEKGKAQFERHQTVNTQDVENAVWHFLCAVRAPGGSVAEARKALIPIEGDGRIPMKEVHELFAGRGTVGAVLAAAAPDEDGQLSERERNHLCYAHLYLGLYHEALGEVEMASRHLREAAFTYSMDHYMGKVAQVHAKLRGLSAVP